MKHHRLKTRPSLLSTRSAGIFWVSWKCLRVWSFITNLTRKYLVYSFSFLFFWIYFQREQIEQSLLQVTAVNQANQLLAELFVLQGSPAFLWHSRTTTLASSRRMRPGASTTLWENCAWWCHLAWDHLNEHWSAQEIHQLQEMCLFYCSGDLCRKSAGSYPTSVQPWIAVFFTEMIFFESLNQQKLSR